MSELKTPEQWLEICLTTDATEKRNLKLIAGIMLVTSIYRNAFSNNVKIVNINGITHNNHAKL